MGWSCSRSPGASGGAGEGGLGVCGGNGKLTSTHGGGEGEGGGLTGMGSDGEGGGGEGGGGLGGGRANATNSLAHLGIEARANGFYRYCTGIYMCLRPTYTPYLARCRRLSSARSARITCPPARFYPGPAGASAGGSFWPRG